MQSQNIEAVLRDRDLGDVSAAPAARGAAVDGAAPYGSWLTAALALLLAWRIGALYFAQTELFFDEAQYWFWSRELASGYYSKPPLIAWIIRAATEVCGAGEFCVRLASPILHTGTAIIVFLLARELYGRAAAFWSALTFATLPGVAFSSGVISTDVPLLFFWAAALLAFVKFTHSRPPASWAWALLLGLCLGFGLLAKYAMLYFLLCAAIYCVIEAGARRLLLRPPMLAAAALAALIIFPNIIWNMQNSFATISHTADNANWSRSLFNPGKALEFLGGQFAVFGPILFGAFLWLSWRGLKGRLGAPERLLLSFSIPLLLLVTAQAFLSRAHANWAAPAYIAASILTPAMLLKMQWARLLRASVVLHLTVTAMLGIGSAFAGKFSLPGGLDPYERVLGWKLIAEAAGEKARAAGCKAIATGKRALTAELFYYLRGALPVVAWRGEGGANDHFKLKRPLDASTPEPILLVTFDERIERIAPEFSVQPLGAQEFPAGQGEGRTVYFFALERLKQGPSSLIHPHPAR